MRSKGRAGKSNKFKYARNIRKASEVLMKKAGINIPMQPETKKDASVLRGHEKITALIYRGIDAIV